MLTHIVAMSRNRVIGKLNAIPWQQKSDLERFKKLTATHPIIMGRKTFESIIARNGKPLRGRENVIVTRNRSIHPAGTASIDADGFSYYLKRSEREPVFVIGGGELYALTLPLTHRIYLTQIEVTMAGDTRYPKLHSDEWTVVQKESHPADEKNQYPYTYIEYVRKT